MSDDELKLTRRLFLQHAAMMSAMTGACCGIALKTDAMDKTPIQSPKTLDADDVSPYPYQEPPG
jgi:hypothetical protein